MPLLATEWIQFQRIHVLEIDLIKNYGANFIMGAEITKIIFENELKQKLFKTKFKLKQQKVE